MAPGWRSKLDYVLGVEPAQALFAGLPSHVAGAELVGQLADHLPADVVPGVRGGRAK